MSWYNDLSILAYQSKQFNYNQQQIICLLQEIRSILLALQNKDEEQNQLLRQLLQQKQ